MSSYNNTSSISPETHTYVMNHIGTNDTNLDTDIEYAKEQKSLIDINKKRIYQRVQHNTDLDLPESGFNTVQNQHPLSLNMLNNHADKGYDYRDYPSELEKHNNYDPYISWLHKRNLIGKNKSRYNTHYVNIDSKYRNILPIARTSSDIKLISEPFSFNGSSMHINMSDTSMFNINDKITISGIENKQTIIRTLVTDDYGNDTNYFKFIPDKQYMTVIADNNMTINAALTTDIIEQYNDLVVNFDGFIGDTTTQWYFDTRNYIWTFSGTTTLTLKITENVYGVTVTSSTLPESQQIREDMLIAQFNIDLYGKVRSITKPITYQSQNSDIRWTNPTGGSGTAPIGIPAEYYTLISNKLTSLGLSTPPKVPLSIYSTMEYINKVQNAIRPIFLSVMNTPDNINFSLRYTNANKKYVDSVRITVPENTVVTTSSLIGNVSLKNLNTSNRMFLTAADIEKDLGIYNASTSTATTKPSPNLFYIKLNRPYRQTPFTYSNPLNSGALMITIYENTVSDVMITYQHYGGIPIKYINAQYPVGFSFNNGFQYITDISTNKYIVVAMNRVGFLSGQFGGNNAYIGLINDIKQGYPQPNKYIISLENDYANVVMVKMINSIFPRTQNIIMDGLSGGTKNNNFYWQNQDDGDHVYSITIEPGNYTASELKEIFESMVQKVYRYNNKTITSQINYITLDIDEITDKVTFSNYNVYQPGNMQVYKSQTNLNTINEINTNNMTSLTPTQPSVSTSLAYYQYPNGAYYSNFPNINFSNDVIIINISHPNNNMAVGNVIMISGSLNYGSIPAKYLNGKHIITRVGTNDYDILLTNVNTDSTLNSSIRGGNEIIIYTPNLFCIRFDNPDTFGSILGFRDVGNNTSITPYQTIITNDVLYDGEDISNVIQNISGVQNTNITRIRNHLDLKGPQYILIQCKELQNTRSLGKIKNYFYKILLNDKLDKYIYDSYVDSPIFYNDPIDRINQLTIDIVTSDGTYYDFNGLNHSFVLEIITYDPIPEATNVIQ